MNTEWPFVYAILRSDGLWKVGYSKHPRTRCRELRAQVRLGYLWWDPAAEAYEPTGKEAVTNAR